MKPLVALLLIAASAAVSHATAFDFLQLGFGHIVPYGLDHVLFVLGLFFCCREFATLLTHVTLFTVAHSLSLGVAVVGGWHAPSQAVEVAIALSIAFVGIENLLRQRPGRWSGTVAFAFGLVHGLGFAEAFHGAAGGAGGFALALLGFNVGVELGQLAVVMLAFLIAAKYWERAWYRRSVAVPASTMIALAGLGWAALRIAA
jgi:hypothetical protein